MKSLTIHLFLILITFFIFSCDVFSSNDDSQEDLVFECGNILKDIEDNEYETVFIGNNCWMAENLRTGLYADGSIIPNVTNDNDWGNLTSGAWVFYDNEKQHKFPFGKLYNWYATDNNRKICPEDWHIPTNQEWETLIDHLGGANEAGGKMKETGTDFWLTPNLDATNESGFSGLPGGIRVADGSFFNIGYSGDWIGSSRENVDSVKIYRLWYNDSNVYSFGIDGFGKESGYSVRCIYSNS